MTKRNKELQLIGKNIKKIRASKKMSQEELANVSELHRTYIGNIERGEKNPTILTLLMIAKALHVTLNELLEGIYDKKKNL